MAETNTPTEAQKELGTWLGFSEAEIVIFVERVAKRDNAGKGWDNLSGLCS